MKKILLASTLFIITFFTSLTYGMHHIQREQNKQIVVTFYNAAVNQKDFDVASQYLGEKYIQHNPKVADGREGLKNFIEFLRTNFPEAHNEIKRIFTDGNYVILHAHSIQEPNTKGRAIIDIFKLENGKIIEHWDVIQDIPETSANSNGMF